MIREINYIPPIAQALKAGHAAIMVGSGFSRYADKCNGMDCDFLSWDQRIDCFYEKLYGRAIRISKQLEETPGKISGFVCITHLQRK